jgi:CPA2 family monovalent cation:H+ antiporter-2
MDVTIKDFNNREMAHTALIATLVAGFGLAFLFALIAHSVRLSPLLGYLAAGVLIGPFTPGFVADQALAQQLAEVGVVLLMFGVGLHFSAAELVSLRAVAVPGALGQITIVTLLGMLLALLLGWSFGAAVVFGLALSVGSTVAVLRTLQERHLLDSEVGRTAVGWLIIQDLIMIFALVLLPALSGVLGGAALPEAQGVIGFDAPRSVWGVVGITLLKVLAFIAVMMAVGRRVTPWILHYVAHTGSRELFRLAVLAIALGVAFGSAELFGVSFALGAFFAGLMLAESQLSQRAAQETLPLRDAFAVLFFVSVGMLVDPSIVLRDPLPVTMTLLIIVVGNAAAATAMAYVLHSPVRNAAVIGASLSQIGEFSFILAGLGVGLQLLPEAGHDYILAGAILSILINPLLFYGLSRLIAAGDQDKGNTFAEMADRLPVRPTTLTNHAILVGHGRVGSLIADALRESKQPFLVIEEDKQIISQLQSKGVEVVAADTDPNAALKVANVSSARWLISTVPEAFESGNLIKRARAASPSIEIIARAHSDEAVEHLKRCGANLVIMGEREIGRSIANHLVSQISSTPLQLDS